MKYIVYKIEGYISQYNPDTDQIEQVLSPAPVRTPYSDSALAEAKETAYNGEYTIEDDGVEEISEPTQLDRVEAQVTYTAMMTDTLLEV